MSLKDIDPADVEKIAIGCGCYTWKSCFHQVDVLFKGTTRRNYSAVEKGEDIADYYIRAGKLDEIFPHFVHFLAEEHQRTWRTNHLRRTLLSVVKGPVQFDPETIAMMDGEQLDALRRDLHRISDTVETYCKPFNTPRK